jgi:hypothetical protein
MKAGAQVSRAVCGQGSQTALPEGDERESNDGLLPYGPRKRRVALAESHASPPRDTRFKPGNQAAKNRQLRLVKLDTLAKVRRSLWEVTRDLRKGTMRADVGNAAVNALRLLLQIHQLEEQDAHFQELKDETRELRGRLQRLQTEHQASLLGRTGAAHDSRVF